MQAEADYHGLPPALLVPCMQRTCKSAGVRTGICKSMQLSKRASRLAVELGNPHNEQATVGGYVRHATQLRVKQDVP